MTKRTPSVSSGAESSFAQVRALITTLPNVVEGTIHGAPSWKVGRKLLACQAIHNSAEPDSLLIKIPNAERSQLLGSNPATFYITDHYQNDPVILVRLSKIERNALQALLEIAWRFVSE